jgi:hypothetical protein
MLANCLWGYTINPHMFNYKKLNAARMSILLQQIGISSAHLASLAWDPCCISYHRDSCAVEDRNTNLPNLPAPIPHTRLRTRPTLENLSSLLVRPQLHSYSAVHLIYPLPSHKYQESCSFLSVFSLTSPPYRKSLSKRYPERLDVLTIR